jgi:hypothetical protein
MPHDSRCRSPSLSIGGDPIGGPRREDRHQRQARELIPIDSRARWCATRGVSATLVAGAEIAL